jgi:DNA helicase-2/ATP-dependent DNA helicase PcrA
MEEDLFPSQMMLSSRADLEEERRLFYVAITRAESKLFLAYATTRYRFGRPESCEPSRFLKKLILPISKPAESISKSPSCRNARRTMQNRWYQV